jgi:hypothetical protein
MKDIKINLATTFNEEGYELYGKRWIETVAKFWPADTNVTLYVDFDIPNLPSNFTVKSFSRSFPGHPAFIERVKHHFEHLVHTTNDVTLRKKAPRVSELTIKFSHKAFVINQELTRTDADIFIWLDGDVETISDIKAAKIDRILKNNFLACQLERRNTKHLHAESGILIFRLQHEHTTNFQKEFNDFYNTDRLFNVRKPYDGFVIGRVLSNDEKLNYIDFNIWRKDHGLTSTVIDTFQHPFLKKRFIHYISHSKNQQE